MAKSDIGRWFKSRLLQILRGKMADIVNLRRARKEKARLAVAEEKAKRRAEFGVSRATRKAADRDRSLEAKRLEAHLREVAAGDDPAR
jgi:Domain of unknown function (DUF4169)